MLWVSFAGSKRRWTNSEASMPDRCPQRVKLRNTRNEQIFSALPPITDILGDRLARLSSGGREYFHPCRTWRATCPRRSAGRRDFWYLLAGWKLDSFGEIRLRINGRFAPEAAPGSLKLQIPLYSEKQTQLGTRDRSETCHERTHALRQISLFDNFVGAGQQRGWDFEANRLSRP
jgi:hypothetical protein